MGTASLPAAKPGGRPREVEIWNILNAILYLYPKAAVGVLSGDFPAWQTVYTTFATGASTGHG